MALVTPTFSVVVATYDRGALIAPTLESVARQTVRDIEVLVVSDGPAAPGLAATVAAFGDRFRLVELPVRHGSQFAPNNHGWSLAQGHSIAYLGHDDIWLPGHLAALLDAFVRVPVADFVASGCIQFGPPGSGTGHTWVTGIFDPLDPSVARTHFFPPSSVAHRRDLPLALRWPDAHAVRRPVDSQFMLSAAEQGCVFTSTGTVTVLKFNSAYRYLSYLCPDDDEQRSALALLDRPGELDALVGGAIADATESGRAMSLLHVEEGGREPGAIVRTHSQVRGIVTPPVMPLSGPTWVPLGDDPRGFDWHHLEQDGRREWRWSGPNPRPRLLIPLSHPAPVRVKLFIDPFATADVRESLAVLVDRRAVDAVVRQEPGSPRSLVEFTAELRTDLPTVVELQMARTVPVRELDPDSPDPRRVGVCLTGVLVSPH